MANVWDADVEVTAERAARLIERQFPELAPARLRLLGSGWDNVAFAVNGQVCFRFPHRALAAGLLRNEIRVLPYLAPFLALPITAPTFCGAPDEAYPYPFAGYPLIPGITACRAGLSDVDREAIAEPLARFCATLHAIPVPPDAREWAPGDVLGRGDIARRVPAARERLVALRLEGEQDLPAILGWLDRLAATPAYGGPGCWLHGDLYARHLLVDAEKRLCGVIDWGDVHLGDPSVDLSVAFSFLPLSARERFRSAYGAVDPAAWDRARFRALNYGIVLTEYGRETGDAAILAAARYALRSASADNSSAPS